MDENEKFDIHKFYNDYLTNKSKEALLEKLTSPKVHIPVVERFETVNNVCKQLVALLNEDCIDYEIDFYHDRNYSITVMFNTLDIRSKNMPMFREIINNVDGVFSYPRTDERVVLKLTIKDLFSSHVL